MTDTNGNSDTHMSDLTERTPIIDRGLALHKMIRYADAPPSVALRSSVLLRQAPCSFSWW